MHTFLFRLQTFPGTLIIIDPHEYSIIFPGLLVGRGKKSQISPDFQGQIRGKNDRFHGNLRKFSMK